MQEILKITKALSDESRLRSLMAISDGELCLCQLIRLLALAPSTVSKHLQILQDAGLVERRKEGRWHFYRQAGADASPEVRKAIDWVADELGGSPVVLADVACLERIRNSDLEELAACYRT